MRWAARAVGCTAWVSLVIISCQPEVPPPFVAEADLAQTLLDARCRVAIECACSERPFEDVAGCQEAERLSVEDYIAVAERASLAYDGVCVGEQLERSEARGCAPHRAFDGDPLQCVSFCKPYVGNREEGESCARLGITVDVDDCAQGLRCADRACVPMCDRSIPVGRGGQCRAGIVDVATCELGLYCDVDGQCASRAELGEPCGDLACLETAFCDLSGAPDRCAPRREAGSDCEAGAQCVGGDCADGRCVEVLPLACEP